MITVEYLQQFVNAGIISIEQSQKIILYQQQFATLPETPPAKPKSSISFANTLYYMGGFFIIFAISYFLGTNWENLGDLGRIASSLFLIVLFGSLGIYLRKTPYKNAGVLLLLAATIAIPLFIHSIERATGLWVAVDRSNMSLSYENFLERMNTAWVILDMSTLIICFIIFHLFKEPILSLPIAHFSWFLILDATNFVLQDSNSYDSKHFILKSWLSLVAGLGLVCWGLYYHLKKNNRVGVWPWIYGLGIMLGSIIALRFESDISMHLLYQLSILVFGGVVLFVATPLRSKTFLTFGSIAIFWFMQDISWTYFRESLGFSFMLIISGLLTISIGMMVQKYYQTQFST